MDKPTIIFLIFKRPRETALVWEEIKKAQPKKLFIVADGPRNADEGKLVEAARAIVETVDWPCEVKRNYSETNLGCRRRVWTGLDWAFGELASDTDGAIILEDDCLPEQSFFSYAQEMLEKYRNNPQVMHIGGTCFQQDNPKLSTALSPELSTGTINLTKPTNSYYFSHIAQIWGWATWKRAWKLYDGKMESWPTLRDTPEIRSAFPTRLTYHYWRQMFDRVLNNETDTWDIAWTYTVFKNKGLCVMPLRNLITNIGSNVGATHKANQFSNLPTSPLIFPLAHPQKIEVHEKADAFTYKKIFGIKHTLKNTSLALFKDKLPFLFNHIKRLVK